jgi:heme exporter protein A
VEPAAELDGVAKLYGPTAALRALDLRIWSGQCLALLGPNGSGKTTLLKILAGAVTPTLGSLKIFGQDARRATFPRSTVGLMASESYLYEDLTARENLRFTLTMAGRAERATSEAGGGVQAVGRSVADPIARTLGAVGLQGREDERVRTFSSGMKRRLSLARLMLLRPRLILLDEPYNSLDAEACDLIDSLVRDWRSDGRAVVVATHDAPRALALADAVAGLERGSLTYAGSVPGFHAGHAKHVG